MGKNASIKFKRSVMRLFHLWGGLGALASHMVKDTTNVQEFLDPWVHPKYACINKQYMQVGTMCGRSGNYDRSAEQQCFRGYDVKSYASQNHYLTKYSKTGAGKYRFTPNGSGRSDLPTLQFSKLKVADTVGPSYKFDFNQNYMGFIFWARWINGEWVQSDGLNSDAETVNIHLAEVSTTWTYERIFQEVRKQIRLPTED